MGIFSCRDLLIYAIIAMPLHYPKVLIDISILPPPLNLNHEKGAANYWVRTLLPILFPKFPLPSVVTEPLSPVWSKPH